MAIGFNHFPKIASVFKPALKRIVEKTATGLKETASINAPIDTGFLRSSIYTVTKTKSTYGHYSRMTKTGKRRHVKVDTSEMLPEVDKPDDDLTAYVAVGASYGIYVELGTRHMAAQPYFLPALEFMRPLFQQECDAIEKDIKELTGL